MFAPRGGGRGADRLTPTRVYTNARISNLIPLCSSCHSQVSHGVITIESAGPDLIFTFNDGARFVSRGRGLPRRMDFVTGSSFDE